MAQINLPFGIDVSRYQGMINWPTVMASKEPYRIDFAGIRATVSWGYQDSWFPRNWQEAKEQGRIREQEEGFPCFRMAYHVVFPGEPWEKQIDNFLRMLGDDFGELPGVLDLELDHGHTPATINDNVWKQADKYRRVSGKQPILYSRKSWVDVYMRGATWLNNFDWWLAQYLSDGNEHPGPVLIPTGVDRSRAKVHQTASHGKPIGVESKQLDYNRWQGTLESLYLYAGYNKPQPPQTDCDKSYAARWNYAMKEAAQAWQTFKG